MLLLRRQYEFPFGINIVQISTFFSNFLLTFKNTIFRMDNYSLYTSCLSVRGFRGQLKISNYYFNGLEVEEIFSEKKNNPMRLSFINI